MSTLKIVGVSIGNLEDITIRALKSIFEADIVYAEDTRNFSKLKGLLKLKFEVVLKELNIDVEKKSQVFSYTDQKHEYRLSEILQNLEYEKNVILVSDAGMPAISDPGYLLIKELRELNLQVQVIPGPTALDSAVVTSGLRTDRFMFLGFLPKKKAKKKKFLQTTTNFEGSVFLYESPNRILETLLVICEIDKTAKVALATELTKKFEMNYVDNIQKLIVEIEKKDRIVGEWVVGIQWRDTFSF